MIGHSARRLVGISAIMMIAQIPALDGNATTLSCAQAAEVAEADAKLPTGLLLAIGNVESGRTNQAGMRAPWPWTVRAAGVGRFFKTVEEAVFAMQALDIADIRSIDIGCFQINLLHHPNAFSPFASGFDPLINAFAAARFLAALYDEFGTWEAAIAAYHSRSDTLGAAYLGKVLVSWHGIGSDQVVMVAHVHVWGPYGELGFSPSMSSHDSNNRVPLLPHPSHLPHVVTISVR